MTEATREPHMQEQDIDGQPLETAPLGQDEPLDFGAIPQDSLLQTVERERDEWKDKAFRTAAEAENVKRRAQQEITDARQYAVTKFAQDVLGVGDNLARALAAPEGNEKALRDGILMVATQLQSMLGRHGIAQIVVKKGDALNPELHQAMSQIPSAEVPEHHILQELQAGFTINGRLLRPSLVVVATAEEGL